MSNCTHVLPHSRVPWLGAPPEPALGGGRGALRLRRVSTAVLGALVVLVVLVLIVLLLVVLLVLVVIVVLVVLVG